jgi:hypothetical protein
MSFRELAQVWVLAAFILSVCAPAYSQNETTSAFTGGVYNATGDPLPGASVELTHAPTGATQYAYANVFGRFTFSGLPPGGPYSLRASFYGYAAHTISPLFLDLGENLAAPLTLLRPYAEVIIEMEKLVVTADRSSSTFASGTNISGEAIDNQPSIDRSLNEYARNDRR